MTYNMFGGTLNLN